MSFVSDNDLYRIDLKEKLLSIYIQYSIRILYEYIDMQPVTMQHQFCKAVDYVDIVSGRQLSQQQSGHGVCV